MNITPVIIDNALSNLSLAVRLSLIAGVQTEQIFSHIQATIDSNSSSFGGQAVEYDPLLGVLQYVNQRVHFSNVENSLLGLLVSQAGRIISYEVIEKHHSLGRVHARMIIYRIRKRLSSIPQDTDWIQLVRGKGYIFLPRIVLVSFSSDATRTDVNSSTKSS